MTRTKTEYQVTMEKAYFLLKKKIDQYNDQASKVDNITEVISTFIKVHDVLIKLTTVYYD